MSLNPNLVIEPFNVWGYGFNRTIYESIWKFLHPNDSRL